MENLFERRAERVLKYLNIDHRYGESYLPRPFFVEFTGSPDSGKTTTIDELYKFFKTLKFRVLRPQEGAEVIQHIPRTTPEYNIRTADYARTQLMDLSNGHMYDLVLFDRCLFDGYCWMMYWETKGQLTPDEVKLYQNFFLSRFWVDKLDAAYFVVCNPDEAMRRTKEVSLTDRLGNFTNPQTIKVLVERFQQAYKDLSPKFPQLRIVDTSGMDKQHMVEHFANAILSAMENKVATKKEVLSQAVL
ncbi:MAG: hypothetical protein A2915_01460 [Candidatus Yanofskybacteria bacterium RIFCSPLOWO2_01_FULL_41_34]|uniref:NadR/Ttd14 AAA domain-containing protein n=1 Tax=Candidatus Yanofskybacteria bacterium RIFCSPHIGHO2_01_FULL_41_26 TaxID=1802661 RepID=A0A1F8EAW9_9BACT|nr:MAG: hypothetical protein A2649_01935 [Candidatus Yanofskybacteria bacterium RIFCSPHIGHO2_01_FULL_41_26]OGN21897.1 MAG: hypothetical protein A2915_01460 [Candidatus Yanofskybacteria bacterium RIFCSPLOWO2_01_FULL_41_34]